MTGRLLLNWLVGAQRIIFILGGAVVIFLGVLIMVGHEVENLFCRIAEKIRRVSSPGDLVFLGLLMAFLPCAPHLVLLAFVALSANSIFQGMGLAGAFGIGASVSALILGTVSGEVSRITFSKRWVRRAFRIVCGGLIIGVGIHLLTGILL